jgi:hypothetical protein
MFELAEESQHLNANADILRMFRDRTDARREGIEHSTKTCVLNIELTPEIPTGRVRGSRSRSSFIIRGRLGARMARLHRLTSR